MIIIDKMEFASKTANNQYEYDMMIHGKSLDEWVQESHKFNSEKNGWNYAPLKKGSSELIRNN